jgi:hypothetical protein
MHPEGGGGTFLELIGGALASPKLPGKLLQELIVGQRDRRAGLIGRRLLG